LQPLVVVGAGAVFLNTHFNKVKIEPAVIEKPRKRSAARKAPLPGSDVEMGVKVNDQGATVSSMISSCPFEECFTINGPVIMATPKSDHRVLLKPLREKWRNRLNLPF
jgi:hypothetical protein